MQIEIVKAFNPIILKLETQEDVNKIVSVLTLAAENEAATDAEKETANELLDILEPEAD